MSSDQVLPSALIDIGNRCGVRLKDMDWNFKVEADGTILGSQMRPAGSGEKKVPVKLRIFESGGVYVYPHKASRYPRDCKKEITQDEVRGIRRELPGACAETTQSLVEEVQDAGFGSRVPYCSTFQLQGDDLIIDSPPIPSDRQDCFIQIKPNGTAMKSCVPTPTPVDVVPFIKYIIRFDSRTIAKVKEILSKPTE